MLSAQFNSACRHHLKMKVFQVEGFFYIEKQGNYSFPCSFSNSLSNSFFGNGLEK